MVRSAAAGHGVGDAAAGAANEADGDGVGNALASQITIGAPAMLFAHAGASIPAQTRRRTPSDRPCDWLYAAIVWSAASIGCVSIGVPAPPGCRLAHVSFTTIPEIELWRRQTK